MVELKREPLIEGNESVAYDVINTANILLKDRGLKLSLKTTDDEDHELVLSTIQ